MKTDKELRDAIAYNKTRGLVGMPIAADEFALLVEAYQDLHGLKMDGMYGPTTQARVVEASVRLRQPHVFAVPATTKDALAFYGDPSAPPRPDGKANAAWQKRYIIDCHGADRLPGAPEHLYVSVHVRAEPIIREGLGRALLACPEYRIKRIGGFNYRGRSSDSSRLSIHALGAAVDIDADDNRAVRFEPGRKPVPFSAAWRKVWPNGLPQAFVTAMTSVGLVWGGDFKTYVDPQHFQAAGPLA